jgi:hypothetical protein
MKHITKIGIVGITLMGSLAGMFGWRWYDNRYPTWKEEVQLSDGRVIVIKQKHEYYENYGTNQSWVTFSLPEMGGAQTWHSYLRPMRLDVFEGKIYVFGSPRGERQFDYYRLPKNYLVAFSWNGQTFVRIPFLSVPEAIRREENLYSCVPENRSRLVDIQIKAKEWCPVIGDRWKFGKAIKLDDYIALANFYARLRNATTVTD